MLNRCRAGVMKGLAEKGLGKASLAWLLEGAEEEAAAVEKAQM
jgi:hypothetical protein